MSNTSAMTLFLLLTASASCLHEPENNRARANPLMPEVRRGNGPMPQKAVLLRARCGSMEYPCPESARQTVMNIVGSRIEFAGLSVVEESQLNPETRQRTEEVETSGSRNRRTNVLDMEESAERESYQKRTVIIGSIFEDMSPAERQRVLADAGADGVISTRIIIGAADGFWTPKQGVEVMVQLSGGAGTQLVWATRCRASGDYKNVNFALEHATRCAMQGALGR